MEYSPVYLQIPIPDNVIKDVEFTCALDKLVQMYEKDINPVQIVAIIKGYLEIYIRR